MPKAEIIAIGTELLLGEIQDTNTRYLARQLRDAGVDLYRSMIVGDNAERISLAIREGLLRSQIIITTGGLGPTIDDPTRQAVALAMGVEIEFKVELWEQIQNRFQRFGRMATENNRRQAFIPQGAIAVENPVGTAPAFIFETPTQAVISLPGVPREMEYLMENKVLPYLKKRFDLHGTIKACVLHASGIGESQVDEWIGDLETLANPTVGLLAHPGQIDIRITAKAESITEADQMIRKVADIVNERLGHHIYGMDNDTLESVTQRQLHDRQWSLAIIECGLDGNISSRLQKAGARLVQAEIRPSAMCEHFDKDGLDAYRISIGADVLLALSFTPGAEKQTLRMVLITPQKTSEAERTYGGPPSHSPLWSTNTALDFLRKRI